MHTVSCYGIKAIKSINTKDYRAFCLGEQLTLKPGKVNLFSGSNGSGKTSICEAIEYALTGEIRRNSGSTEHGFVNIEVENNNFERKNYNSKIDLNKKKELDNAWYGTVSTSLSRKSELSNNFSIFNHLDSKSAFDLFDSEEKDILKVIKNMVVGEDVIECEKNIDRFYKAFMDAEKNMKKEIDYISKNIDQIEKELLKVETSNFEENREYLVNNISTLYEKEKTINNINEQYLELSQISGCADQLEKYVINCSQDITYDELSIRKNELLSNIDALKVRLLNCNEKKTKREGLVLQIDEISQSITALKTKLYSHMDIKKKYDDLMLRAKSLSYSTLKSFLEDYSNKSIEFQILNQIIPVEIVNNIALLDSFDLNAHGKIIKEKEDYRVLQSRLEILNDQYSREIAKSELESVLLSQLIDLVAEANESLCPLCGVNHNTPDNLKRSMATARKTQNTDQNMISLKMEIERNLAESKKCEKTIQNLIEKDKITVMLMDVHRKIIKNTASENNFNELNTIQHSIAQLESLKAFINDSEGLYQQIENFIQSDLFIRFNNTEHKDFALYCANEINEIETSMEKLKKIKETTVSDIDEISADMEKNPEELLTLINNGRESFESINSVLNSIACIEQIFGKFYQVSSISDWIKKYRNISFLLEKLKHHDESLMISSNLALRKQQEQDLLMKRKEERKNCLKAINVILALSKTDDYIKGFLIENANKIERIFGSIHRPKEFSDLKIEDGNVTFIRSTETERIASNQMSTGQSVALAISLILSLYTSSSSAPKVLIFDEPIANMDDLHMMNFIDIIRETAISGTQIFVTTANDNVAGLIRRKFSFFGKEFKHFSFERGDSTPAIIKQIEYDPNKESFNEVIVNTRLIV